MSYHMILYKRHPADSRDVRLLGVEDLPEGHVRRGCLCIFELLDLKCKKTRACKYGCGSSFQRDWAGRGRNVAWKPSAICIDRTQAPESTGPHRQDQDRSSQRPGRPRRVGKLLTPLELCVSSLRRGRANLLCVAPIFTDDPRRESAF